MNDVIVLRMFLVISFWCLIVGAGMGQSKVAHAKDPSMQPYENVMQEAIDGLHTSGIDVAMPKHFPHLLSCGSCLTRHGAFGAYLKDSDEIVVPENFNIATAEDHAILVHEYGHYLLTNAGMPSGEQEALCLQLGNASYNPFFVATR